MIHVSMMRPSLCFEAENKKASSASGIFSNVKFSRKVSFERVEEVKKITEMKKKYLLKAFVISLVLTIFTNCTGSPEGIVIKDAHLYTPLKGSMMTGGYLSLSNISDDFVEIKDIDCAPFKAEIHETKTDSTGIMKMEKIESLLLNPDSQIIFVPGGKHIMLQGLSGFKEPELDCSFILTDQDPIKFKFEVIKRG